MRTTLTATLQNRLEKLAAEAGSTPEKMLPFVMRDGFDYCQHVVDKVKEGLAQVQSDQTEQGNHVIQKAQSLIQQQIERHKLAA